MSANPQLSAAGGTASPLSEAMLMIDIVNTLGHSPEMATAPDAVDRLAGIYHALGIRVAENTLKDGIAAFSAGTYTHRAQRGGIGAALARLYVGRAGWLPAATAVALMLVIGLGGYFLVYRPYHQSQLEQAQIDLTKTMPATMDALYQSIYTETKIQQATNDAADLRDHGKAAAAQGDRAGAQAAIDALNAILTMLELEFRVTVVDRSGSKWGFWTFPDDNAEATNYYLVVEARNGDGGAVQLPIVDESSGKSETVAIWAIRVPEDVYRAVEADKADDGVIEHNLIGVKQSGFLDIDFVVQTLGGTLTRW